MISQFLASLNDRSRSHQPVSPEQQAYPYPFLPVAAHVMDSKGHIPATPRTIKVEVAGFGTETPLERLHGFRIASGVLRTNCWPGLDGRRGVRSATGTRQQRRPRPVLAAAAPRPSVVAQSVSPAEQLCLCVAPQRPRLHQRHRGLQVYLWLVPHILERAMSPRTVAI